jgi:DNA-binding transcriptional ArsR family regulator
VQLKAPLRQFPADRTQLGLFGPSNGTLKGLAPATGAVAPVASLVAASIVSRMANDAFHALAHPIRRGIVERLAHGPATIGEATGRFAVSKPTITRHVKVLEDSGVVARTIDGRTHQLSLELDALGEAVDWIDRQRAIWERMFDAVEDVLEEQAEAR